MLFVFVLPEEVNEVVRRRLVLAAFSDVPRRREEVIDKLKLLFAEARVFFNPFLNEN